MNDQKQVWSTTVLEDPSDPEGAVIQFPDDMMTQLGWKEGDTLKWTDLKDGSFSISKVVLETQWVMVDTISTFRVRYMVEVPIGIDNHGHDKSLWALDTVTCEEAKEFSQLHIGEQIVSHRVMSKDEALQQCDAENEYGKEWDTDAKVAAFFTTWKEQETD